jgi:hypothetical protein
LNDAVLDEKLELTLGRSRALRARRARRRVLAGSLAAVLIVGVVGVILRPGAPVLPAKTAAWQLVSYVDTNWQQLPSVGFGSGFGLDCPETSTCYAVDFEARQVEVTQDGGSTWQHADLPGGFITKSAIACTDSLSCSLVGIDRGEVTMVTTADGGETWAAHPLGVHGSDSLGLGVHLCQTASSCIATVTTADGWTDSTTVLVTHDGG